MKNQEIKNPCPVCGSETKSSLDNPEFIGTIQYCDEDKCGFNINLRKVEPKQKSV